MYFNGTINIYREKFLPGSSLLKSERIVLEWTLKPSRGGYSGKRNLWDVQVVVKVGGSSS